MFNEIVPKENIKFKDLEKKIFRCMNMFGCLILKNILEEQEEKIFKERDTKKYENKGFEGTSVHTIMGAVPYRRRRYKVTQESISKSVYLLDEQLKISAVKKVSSNVVEKILDIVKSNTYRDTTKILEETIGVRLSFETIRNIVLEVGEKIEDRGKRLVELKKEEKFVRGEKEVVAKVLGSGWDIYKFARKR